LRGPRFENLPGKIELDAWGRILMSPASNDHGIVQGRLCQRLVVLGGQALVGASVVTAEGIEAWIACPQTKRFEFFGTQAALQHSRYAVDLSRRFD
jgi:hypothetical protein